ncbi:enoyl-CoA hydratase/isomerase family protein [Nakamurella sp. YIM 132087]|uniref:enoyl-CoA hydratase n=1 Tax=Nakamurella alba TaxID=2665158 RepID=A0A7K1FRG0_9ACTN|nr:enoyl-CoA hydratase/isomerase family protein [Nakamurella alba]MTD16725.1 enoyl-CoA hydratase/isomerase family protein [Nakamurella alba]
MGDTVLLEVQGAVGVVRLNRPPVNAMNREMHKDLYATARTLAQTPEVRAVVVYGGERAFAAGADVSEMADLDPAGIASFGRGLSDAIDFIGRLPVPVIAAVNGYALGGGCELVLAADLRVVARDARIGVPEISLGVIPGAGGTQRLPRLIGSARAKEMIFTGKPVSGEEAGRIGLANRVVEPDEVFTVAMALAEELAAGATAAIAAAKTAVDRGLDGDLAGGLALEGRLFADLFATEDQKIGMSTFLQEGPGKARFVGR